MTPTPTLQSHNYTTMAAAGKDSILDFTRQRHAIRFEEREERQQLAEIKQEQAELVARKRQFNDELIAFSQRHISYLEANSLSVGKQRNERLEDEYESAFVLSLA